MSSRRAGSSPRASHGAATTRDGAAPLGETPSASAPPAVEAIDGWYVLLQHDRRRGEFLIVRGPRTFGGCWHESSRLGVPTAAVRVCEAPAVRRYLRLGRAEWGHDWTAERIHAWRVST